MTARRVFMRDVNACGYCSRGARVWLKSHGFDVADFVKNGMTQETLEATGDEFSKRILARIRKERTDG